VTGLAAHVTGTIVAKSRSPASATTAATARTITKTASETATTSCPLVPHLLHPNLFFAQLFRISSQTAA